MISLSLNVVVAQWVLLFALGLLVIVMYRQLAYLLDLRAGQPNGLSVGSLAPDFDYVLPRTAELRRFTTTDHWSLIMFANPICTTCARALASLERVISTGRLDSVQTLVVSVAGPIDEVQNDLLSATEHVGIVEHDVVHRLYKTEKTPFFYTVDPAGIIRGAGAPVDQAEIEKLLAQSDVPRSRGALALRSV